MAGDRPDRGAETEDPEEAGGPLLEQPEPARRRWPTVIAALVALAAAAALLCLPRGGPRRAGSPVARLSSEDLQIGAAQQDRGAGAAAEQETCLVTGAVGKSYIALANLTGRTKEAYAARWGYRYLQYSYATPAEFVDWCHGTELGSRFPRERLSLNHPMLKYCILEDALAGAGCGRALWTDADAVMVNWEIPADFRWPGAVMSSFDKPYALYPMLPLPGSVQIQPLTDDYCLTEAPCTKFTKFWTCLNSGVFLLDSSPAAHDYIFRMLNGTVNNMSRALGCSTASYNPSGRDQCGQDDGMWDQCMSGCVWQQENEGGDADEMPRGVLCTDALAQPRMQEALGTVKSEDISRYIQNDTYVVNVAGDDKENNVRALMLFFPHLRQFFKS